jgi:L-asparaginase II
VSAIATPARVGVPSKEFPLADPVLIETTRGGVVESRHRGAFALVSAKGDVIAAAGDIDRTVFPRSAMKLIQALPLVETGAADAFGLTQRELALACASHSSEAGHVDAVDAWLARLDLSEEDLICGAHPPRHRPSDVALMRAGAEPSRLHNNCSGKHAGFLTLARHLGAPTEDYVRADHPVQRHVLDTFAALAGFPREDFVLGTDGCSAVNPALPLFAFARAMAVCAAPSDAPEGMSGDRQAAIARLTAAVTAEPWYIAGTGRACTAMIEASGGRALVKVGAEGVYGAILPELGLGFALKIEDGATRAAEAAMAQTLIRLGLLAREDPRLSPFLDAPIRNFRDEEVGRVRALPDAFDPLDAAWAADVRA